MARTKFKPQSIDDLVYIESRIIQAIPSHASVSGFLVSLQAYETLSFGDACAVQSDSKAHKASATTYLASYLCIESLSADQFGKFLVFGTATHSGWTFSPGNLLYTGVTAGSFGTTPPGSSGQFIQCVGVAIGVNTVLFKPSPDYFTLA